MADFYLELDTTTGLLRRREATDVGGTGRGGRIVALRSDGTLDASMLPNSSAVVVNIVANEALNAGDFVNVFHNGTERRVRRANAVSTTAPAHGFVLASATAGSEVSVYFSGLNSQAPRGSLTAADVGRRVFLSASTAGAYTLTPPNNVNNIVQQLGIIAAVDTTNNIISIVFDPQAIIVL